MFGATERQQSPMKMDARTAGSDARENERSEPQGETTGRDEIEEPSGENEEAGYGHGV